MQKEARTEPFTGKLLNERPRFIATAVICPQNVRHGEEAPWKGSKDGAKVPEGLELPAVTHVGPSSHFNRQFGAGSSISVADRNHCVVEESTLAKEASEEERNMASSSATSESEPDTRAGGSIRDRIAALSAAAGVSRLNVTPGREQSKITVTEADETHRRIKAGLSVESVKSSEKAIDTESQREFSRISAKDGVAFNVEFQSASKGRPPPRVLSRFTTANVESKDETVVSEHRIVSNTELGTAIKDKSVAFEVNFDDEPRSKRAKDEPVLLQSPFKALKVRSILRRHQRSKPSQPQGVHCISLSNVADKVFLASFEKDESKSKRDPSSGRENGERTLVSPGNLKPTAKRSEFSFVLEKRVAKKEISGELPVDTNSNDIAIRPEAVREQSDDEVPKLLKRNTFTLDTVSDQGLPIVNVLKEVSSKEESEEDIGLPTGEEVSKRSTFTLDPVSQSIENASSEGLPVVKVLNELANKAELQQSKLHSDADTSSLPDDKTQKRSTFTLESVSQEIESAIEQSGIVTNVSHVAAKDLTERDNNCLPSEPVPDDTLVKEELTSNEKNESSEKRSTYSLDAVSSSLQSGAEDGVPVAEVLCEPAKREEYKSSTLPGADDSSAQVEYVPKRGTFTLDTVSQTLEDAQEQGLPTVDVLDQLASEHESYMTPGASTENTSNSKPPVNRGTYTLETVSHAIEEAVELGIPASVTLNRLAQEGKPLQNTAAHGDDNSSAGDDTCGLKTHRTLSLDHRDEIEASFEDALEQLEDCVTFVAFPSASHRERPFSDRKPSPPGWELSSSDLEQSSFNQERSSLNREGAPSSPERSSSDRELSSETSEKRGTYSLDDVANSVEDGVEFGVPVVETLDRLSKTNASSNEIVSDTQLSVQKRRTYTLDEVSLSLQTASEQGVPVVEALKSITKGKEAVRGTGERAQKRGTYTLNDVSKSLEHAKKTGIPVIEALESLSKEKPPIPLRLKIPERSPENRGTYTLDDVSYTLEKAKQKGLPVVDALGQMTVPKDVSLRQTPDAVHRRQEKLVNRKTYALASPLETIGEGAKLRLYDGSQRQLMSPLSLHVKANELTTSKANGSESKARGLGVVQKLDFLTSACELLLQANAKEMSKDLQTTASCPKNTLNNPTGNESVRRLREDHPERVNESVKDNKSCPGGNQTERRTYSLDSVSQTIDDANAAGISVVDALNAVTFVAKTDTHKTNLMRLNSKSDSELTSEGNEKHPPERCTYSLEDMSRTLEEAKKAGIPVIQALDQLTNELVEFSRTRLGGDLKIAPLDKENRKRKRYSETTMRHYKPTREQSPGTSPLASPYPPPIRKAYSLDDVAFAVQRAFQSGTSLSDFLDSVASEKPAEPVSSSRDVRPRSVDSGFLSSLSDYDISSQSFESSRNRSNTYILDSSNEELDLAKIVQPRVKENTFHGDYTTQSPAVDQSENRRTFTLDHVSGSVEHDLSRGVPVIEALEKLSNSAGLQKENTNDIECNENVKNGSSEVSDKTLVKSSSSGKKQSPPKPKRQISKKSNAGNSNSNAFVIEYFSSKGPQQPDTSKFQIVDNKAQEVDFNKSEASAKNPAKPGKNMENNVTSDVSSSWAFSQQTVKENADMVHQMSMDKKTDLVATKEPELVELKTDSNVTSPRGRATWRPSGSVLDKIASLMDAAEDCGLSPSDVLNQVTDLPCDDEGEIDQTPDEVDDEKVATSQIAYLRMQLEEKRRHIEAEKYRAQAEWEDQRRRLGQTAFWYVIGKAQGSKNVGEGTGPEAMHVDKAPQNKPRKPVAEFPNQPSPPIAWSSPANSPLPSSVSKPSPSDGPQFETREFRLSDYPPGEDLDFNQDVMRPSSQPAAGVSSRPTAVPPRPFSHDPAASRQTAPARKCWDVDVAQVPTPPPLVYPDTASMSANTKQEHSVVDPPGGGGAEIEVEIHTPTKKGLAMFIGDDAQSTTQGLTPEQERKREKFMRLRQKKQEEDKTRKEAELEKKRRREEKQREKEMLQKMEEDRLRQEELDRQKAEKELRMREAQAARVPDSYSTYRRPGPRQHVYDVDDDSNNYFVPAPAQPSGFAEFSGPQCYVKPSGKSNRKIIVNAISYVCLSGTVNQDQKEKCLQAISESDGHHFMILFKDGLKFRGIYVHNLENDQLFKIFGIGPRVVTSKMLEGLFKYNSGGKEFTKIPSKTLSIAVDGFAIQKSYWHSGKPVVQSKTSSNLKRPPRHPQR